MRAFHWSNYRGSPAVHIDGDSGQITGPFRGKEGDDVAGFFRLPDPSQRHRPRGSHLIVKGVQGQTGLRWDLGVVVALVLAALDQADTDGGHQDVVLGQVFGKPLGDGDASGPGEWRWAWKRGRVCGQPGW